jgi:hypothetical protein
MVTCHSHSFLMTIYSKARQHTFDGAGSTHVLLLDVATTLNPLEEMYDCCVLAAGPDPNLTKREWFAKEARRRKKKATALQRKQMRRRLLVRNTNSLG